MPVFPLPLSLPDDVRRLKFVPAFSVSGDVFASTKPASRLAFRLVFEARVDGSAGEADVCVRVGADVAPVSDLPARLAYVEVFFVKSAAYEDCSVLDVVRHFRALEQDDYGGRRPDPVRL